jgi:hypothetical protein
MKRSWLQPTLVVAMMVFPVAITAQRATVVGEIVVKSSAVAVSYAVIGAKPSVPDRFSSADGRFVLRDVNPGKLTLTARHIGYAPLDTTFDVAAGDTVHLRLELSLITIQLPAVHALAQRCAHPGGANTELSAELQVLFDQVKQNADRNRLLSTSYPFEVVVERKISKPEPALEARFVAYDTVVRSSERTWRYAPGNMLGTRDFEPGVFGGRWLTITMPELSDFADQRFLENHCFDFGGIDVVDGDTLLRVDFNPAPVVRTPDVGGTIYLDPKTYQLRLTHVSLVNLTKQLRSQISGQSIRVTFKEAIDGVPVIDVVSSVVFPRDDPKGPALEPSTENQRALAVRFLKGKP